MSVPVVYRSVARFDSALRQIRSSSLGIVSSIWRGGRASAVAIRSRSSVRAACLSSALARTVVARSRTRRKPRLD